MAAGARPELFSQRRRPPWELLIDRGFQKLAVVLASVVGLVLIGILFTVLGAREAIARFGLGFLTTSNWDPIGEHYGAFTAIYGTVVSSLLALAIAVPLGVGTAIFLTENFIPLPVRQVLGLMVELLAAIPSVVLGLWGIFVMEPFLRPGLEGLHQWLGWLPFFSTTPLGPGMAPAVLILVVMILPIITAISRDSLQQVPLALRQAAYGVGTTRWGAIVHVILPAAISGITGGVMLALGRAMGETMAVTMLIGNSNNFSLSLLAPANTISSMLANQFGEADGLQVSALMYAALVLMLLTLVVNLLAQVIVRRLSLKILSLMTSFSRGSLTLQPSLVRNRWNLLLTLTAGLFTALAVLPLIVVIAYVLFKGGSLITLQLLTQLPPPGLDGGGIGNAILGTLIVTLVAALIAVPVGVGAGVYLAEFASAGWFARFVRFGTNVLAGVPSIICGVFVYGLIVSTRLFFNQSYSALAGGIALAVLMLPTVIKTTDEALKLVPQELRWGAMGVGASRFVTISRVTLPAAFSSIATGVVLAVARAAGETAPLIFTALFSPFWPEGLFNPIASMSVLIYNFAIMPYEAQIALAWASSFVLVVMILLANLLARWLGRFSST